VGIARLVAESKNANIIIKLKIGKRFIDFLLVETKFVKVQIFKPVYCINLL